MNDHVTFVVEDGIARVALAAPGEKVNLLGADFLAALEQTAAQLEQESGILGAVVTSKKTGGFIAGADIRMIDKVASGQEGSDLVRRGQRIFDRWAALPFPVVAAVHGHCMGGGTEFILACSYRVAAENAAIALPEVKLGIIPGLGGTQRLPRLISLEKAIDMIVTGRTVRAPQALAMGLVDRVVPGDRLLSEAVAAVRQIAASPKVLLKARRRRSGGLRSLLLEKNRLGRALLFRQARQKVLKKTAGHYPAPLTALEVISRGLELPLPAALELEAQAFGPLAASETSKNLIHVFFLSQRPKKHPGAAACPPLEKAAVLGAGVMGGGIAQLLAAHHIPVLLKDIRKEAVDAGLEEARKIFRLQAERRGEGEGQVAAGMAMITGATEYRGFDEVDLVIEAVVEKMPAKQGVLREVEPLLREKALFATNTSSLSVSDLQAVAAHPERVAGMHFFNPVQRMPLVEVVRGSQTSEDTVNALFAAALKLGKTPITTADRPGFLVNRLLIAYLKEAALLAGSGIDWLSLDRVVTDFGLPMGPFRLLDEIGLDIAAEVSATISHSLPYLPASPLIDEAQAAGLLGKKGGKGFYLYDGDGHPKGPNRETEARLRLRRGPRATEDDLLRLLYLMVNEAGRCLEEEVVGEPAEVDIGMIFGIGFPPFRGGLCRWADRQGLPNIVIRLNELALAHGERFAPCRRLRKSGRFYPGDSS